MPIYKNHLILKPPLENVTLWRYMDIPSFLSLLAESSLVFVRADLFEDKYEGHFTKPTAKLIDENSDAIQLNDNFKPHSQALRDIVNGVYINCWCIGQHEVIHMWKIYSKASGIAIKIDYNSLNESIIDEYQILPGIIKYVDRENDYVDYKNNLLQPYTIKGQEYMYENEFRLIIYSLPDFETEVDMIADYDERNKLRKDFYQKTPIVRCKINLSKLIKEIYISPFAPAWYRDFLVDILFRYNIVDFKISQSNL